MKKSELESLRDQLQGGDSDAPNGHNLVGAINTLLNTYDDADEWGATPADEDWQDAHDDFQYLLRRVVNDLADLGGNDDVLEDDDGNLLADLPNDATGTDTTADIPGPPS